MTIQCDPRYPIGDYQVSHSILPPVCYDPCFKEPLRVNQVDSTILSILFTLNTSTFIKYIDRRIIALLALCLTLSINSIIVSCQKLPC